MASKLHEYLNTLDREKRASLIEAHPFLANQSNFNREIDWFCREVMLKINPDLKDKDDSVEKKSIQDCVIDFNKTTMDWANRRCYVSDQLKSKPTGAIFSDCRTYRYVLWRVWDTSKPVMAVIGINPSTADETEDDPTIRRCISFAKAWGYGGLYMINLFAYRATDPKAMKASSNPVGSGNDAWIGHVLEKCNLILAAWGNHGSFLSRDMDVKNLVIKQGKQLKALAVNVSGQPKHPLYIKADTKPFYYY